MVNSPKNALSGKTYKAYVFLLLSYFNDVANTFVYFKQENQIKCLWDAIPTMADIWEGLYWSSYQPWFSRIES